MRKSWRVARRDALKAKAIEQAFGYENWNVLSAQIEAQPPASAKSEERSIAPAAPPKRGDRLRDRHAARADRSDVRKPIPEGWISKQTVWACQPDRSFCWRSGWRLPPHWAQDIVDADSGPASHGAVRSQQGPRLGHGQWSDPSPSKARPDVTAPP
jgi:hypothetical protein